MENPQMVDSQENHRTRDDVVQYKELVIKVGVFKDLQFIKLLNVTLGLQEVHLVSYAFQGSHLEQ